MAKLYIETGEHLDEALNRTLEFFAELKNIQREFIPPDLAREDLAFAASRLADEYAEAAIALISTGFFAPAFTLLRPQFESMVRGIWILYVASDDWIKKLSAPLSNDAVQDASDQMGLAKLLKHLESSESVPRHLYQQLCSYQESISKIANGFSHAGYPAIAIIKHGTRADLVYKFLVSFNAISLINTNLMVASTGQLEAIPMIRKVWVSYSDVLPIAEGPFIAVPLSLA